MAKKTNNQLALEVLCGKWGSGKTRKEKLTKAGYNYNSVQKIVNDLMKKKSVDAVAKEVIAGKWGNGDVRKKCLTVAGYNYNTVQNKVNALLKPKKSIIDELLEACKVQAEWMKNYVYKWQELPTIAKSKKFGTCVTFIACVLQRIKILKSGESIWIDKKGKVDGSNSKMTVTYPKGTLKSNKNKLRKGDIVIAGNGETGAGQGSHIFVLTGKWNGNDPYIYDQNSASRVKKGQKPEHTWPGTSKLIALIRLKG